MHPYGFPSWEERRSMATITPLPVRTKRERLGRRRMEIARLNGVVQAVLRTAAIRRWPDGGWGLALTVYDCIVEPGDRRGGHWALFWMKAEADEQIVESYAVTVLFGADDRAIAFEVDGERSVLTSEASPGTLADLLTSTGPLRQRVHVPHIPG